jgi:hypothetical protein
MTDIQEALQALRSRFPRWAFLYDPFAHQWIALRGRKVLFTAPTPQQLANRVTHTQNQRRSPRPQPRR